MAQDETNDLAEIAETTIEDEAEENDEVPQVSYEISAYGADYDVDGLVKRLEKGDIFVPSFQRSYVRTLPQA